MPNASAMRDESAAARRWLAVEPAELVLGSVEGALARRGEVCAGAVLVEHEHRHRRAERLGLAARAAIGGPLERARDLGGRALEDTGVEIERVAVLGDRLRPAAGIAALRHVSPRSSRRRG